ncbi:hypothetical protein H5410_009322 [Solanum commersonii]|uniref:DNA-directed RNA polymerase n=1 Tax=Solanum commersonii TaxID=4109 RepID=A0A9J6AHN9_SOLCO|nr:hypothetical protein H5410_009322 [Solanum commersonii]
MSLTIKFHQFTNLETSPYQNSPIMWRNIVKQFSSRTPQKILLTSKNRTYSFLGFGQDSVSKDKRILRSFIPVSCSNSGFLEMGFQNLGEFDEFLRRPLLCAMKSQVSNNDICRKSYASVAEAVAVSSTDAEEDVSVVGEVQELLTELKKEEKKQFTFRRRNQRFLTSGIDRRKYPALKRRQVKIETQAWEQAAKEYRELLFDMCEQKLAPNLPYVKSLFLGWFEPLRDKIAQEQELCIQGKSKAAYSKYFHLLPADMMAVITMHKLMGLLMTGGEHGNARVVQAALTIGDAIEQEIVSKHVGTECIRCYVGYPVTNLILVYPVSSFKKWWGEMFEKHRDFHLIVPGADHALPHAPEKTEKHKAEKDRKMEDGEHATLEQKKLHKKVTSLMKKQKLRAVNQIVRSQDDSKPWGQDAKAKVGSRLIEFLLQTAYIQSPADQLAVDPPDIRPAFIHSTRTVAKETKSASRRYGVIQCDELVFKGLERTARHMVIPYMPMLVPPVKWTGYDKGGHLYLPSYVMRTHGARQQREAVKRASRNQLRPVFEALDTLGSTKWRINKRVLSVVDRIWAGGGRLADLVDRDDAPLPEEPDTEDEAVCTKWRWKVKSVKKENRERHSQRCDIELKLAVAHRMKDEEGFFYPHNVDFRGRAYPMHPHLNHLGSDICRGVLEFAAGRPLGESGLRWLKIHLANLFAGGVDKLSLDGRIAFTESHLDDIFDSADKPLEGRRWWLNAEDPFQCLAVCINLSEAVRSSSPETVISHIPDGSCNGLQHYAALGRDKLGAAAVNLVAGEKPADVYSGIAARVLDIMNRDAQRDPAEFPDAVRARVLVNQLLDDKATKSLRFDLWLVIQVDRKLVKQTVMTSVYGVTYIGARDQIKRRLKERGAIADDSELFGAASYAAKVRAKWIENQLFNCLKQKNRTAAYNKACDKWAIYGCEHTQIDSHFQASRNQIQLPPEAVLVAAVSGFCLLGSDCQFVTLTALGEMFEAARGIMTWLGECAKVKEQFNVATLWCQLLDCSTLVQALKVFSLVDWTVEIDEEKFGIQVEHKSGRTYVFHKWDLVGTPKSNYPLPFFHRVNAPIISTSTRPHLWDFTGYVVVVNEPLVSRHVKKHTLLGAIGIQIVRRRNVASSFCEKPIIASENEPVRWTTPLGLPVVQPYRKIGRHFIKTSLQILTLQRETEKVMVKRQRTAFPPNFIHSLDGSHMMMTAVACRRAGLNFAGVHDSYWTHACDVDKLNRILREKFVELYETPILEKLLESFQVSYPTLSFPSLPEHGDFDLRDVIESPYFFN